jgi:hypothetical protein
MEEDDDSPFMMMIQCLWWKAAESAEDTSSLLSLLPRTLCSSQVKNSLLIPKRRNARQRPFGVFNFNYLNQRVPQTVTGVTLAHAALKNNACLPIDRQIHSRPTVRVRVGWTGNAHSHILYRYQVRKSIDAPRRMDARRAPFANAIATRDGKLTSSMSCFGFQHSSRFDLRKSVSALISKTYDRNSVTEIARGYVNAK